jgi:transcriptional regulator with XRE-family HTH domain
MRPKANQPVDSLVGARIRLLRKQRKMSESELGKAVGVTFQQIQKYENGKSRVGAGRLHLVATALNVPITELFDGSAETGSTLTRRKNEGASVSSGSACQLCHFIGAPPLSNCLLKLPQLFS